jgi:hypothetical protein
MFYFDRNKLSKATETSECLSCLQLVCQMGNLVVDGELLAVVGDDEDTDGSGSTAESLLELGEEVALVDNLEALLDLTSLSHGDELTVIADVDETVLLEDWAEEGVEDDRWGWVRDNTWLLMQLLGEEVNTEVSVLTSLGRGGDADDLAWAVLEDDKVTNADVVAWDGEGGVLGDVVDRRDVGGLLVGVVGRLLVGVVVNVVVLSHVGGRFRLVGGDRLVGRSRGDGGG